MQRVWCTKCGRNNPAAGRWCEACGESVQPRYLSSQPSDDLLLTCRVCGTVNDAGTVNCRRCGAPLSGPTQAQSAVGSGGQGGRIALRPEGAASPPPPPSGGSRLSRLAQARREKEAAQGKTGQDSSDWLSGLRSDAPPPPDYATRMDEDDESDANLAAALREARQQEDEAEGLSPLPFEPNTTPASPPPSTAFNFESESAATPAPFNFESESAAPLAPFNFEESLPPLPDFAEAPAPRPDFATAAPSPAFQTNPQAASDNPAIGEMGDDTSLPDWLRNPASPAAPPPSPPPPTASFGFSENTDSMPDWLRDLAGSSAESGTAESEPETPDFIGRSSDDSGELPDWLQNTGSEPANGPFSFSPPTTDPGVNKEIPEWLRRTTDDLPIPTRPSFGDVDVEQRLSFAFDETTERPVSGDEADSPLRPRHTGLTDLLGLPPLENADDNLPAFTVSSRQSPPFPPPPATGFDDSDLEATQPLLPDLPNFLLDDGPINARPQADFAPWLEDMTPPTDSAADPNSRLEPATEAVADDYPSTLRPWLQGLRPPALDTDDEAARPLALDLPDFVGDDATAENPYLQEEKTDTRSFSVRDMFEATDDGSDDQFLQEAASQASDATSSLADPQVTADRFGLSPFEVEEAAQPVENEPVLPDWLSDKRPADISEPALPTRFNASLSPLTLPPLPGDEAENDAEPIPFELPAFEGPEALPNPTSLASFTGGDPLDFELPDFLSEPGQPPPPPTFSASPIPAEQSDFRGGFGTANLPDFLRTSPSVGPSPSSTTDDDVPDFLRGSPAEESSSTDDYSPTPFSFPTEDAAHPASASLGQSDRTDHSLDFLRQEADAMGEDAPAEEAVPSWLQALSNGTLETPRPKTTTGYSPLASGTERAEEQAGELPTWLREEDGATAAPPPETLTVRPQSLIETPESPAQPSTELDSLFNELETPSGAGTADLSSSRLPSWLNEQGAGPVPEFKLSETNELPDWLNDGDAKPTFPLAELGDDEAALPAAPAFESLPGSGEVGSSFGGSGFLGDVEGPSWLRGTTQPPKVETNSLRPPAPAPVDTSSPPGLPSWLRSVAPAPTAVETEDDLAPPALPTFDPIGISPADSSLPHVSLPPQLASAAVLSALLVPATAVAVSTDRVATRPVAGSLRQAHLLRWGLSALLLVVALVGLLATPLPVKPLAVAPTVQDYYSQIDSLPPNAKVLVSYDWEADRSGEMQPMAQTLTAHLMAKRARLFLISLNPQGPALADTITENLAKGAAYGNSNFYQYGQNYLNLGWRTGQEAAVRSLFSNLGNLNDYRTGGLAANQPIMNGVNSLADFDLIIVLAGDEGGVRTWVEQFGIQPGSHLLFGTPAAVEPLARPYALGLPTADPNLRTSERQVRSRGLLAGLTQTAQYGQLLHDRLNLRTNDQLELDRRLSAQALASLMLVLVVVGANVVYFVRRGRRRL